jgi:hypothetical protein
LAVLWFQLLKGGNQEKWKEPRQNNNKLTKAFKKRTEFLYTIIYGIYGQHFDSEEFKKRAKKESVGWFFPKLKDFNFAQHL